MSDEAGEKVQEASPQKKNRARQKGDTPVSTEATAAAAFGAFLIALFISLPMIGGLARELTLYLVRPDDAAAAVLHGGLGARPILAGLGFVLPLVVLPAVAALVAIGVQGGIVLAPNKLMPKLDKISPIKGAGRKFGPQGLFDFARSSAKALAVALAGSFYLLSEAERLHQAFGLPSAALPALLFREALVIMAITAVFSVVFALIDVPYVRSSYEKRLKMSRQELQDEHKESEGDQGLKARRRQQAERFALGGMLKDVKTADVLVVNPTHYAVALKWDRDGNSLPRCVAKGTDEVALRLRREAHDAGVPIREDAPTARSLYASVPLGEPVKPEHFAVVAAAIRFADRARSARRT